MSAFSRPELFWTTDQLAAHASDPLLRVVDCRFSFARDARPDYLAGHLPGAVYCSWADDLSAPPPPSGHPRWMLQDPVAFAAAMSRLGIGDDTMVVGYDAEGGHHAARLWLALRRYGHDKMAVLDGGIQKWEREGRPLEPGDVRAEPARFTPQARDGVIASKAEVQAAVRTGGPWLLDVRRESEYLGNEVRAARGGHIPGAVHLHWQDALQKDWSLRDPDTLEDLYADAGFSADTATVTYCQGGVRAAFTHLLLTALGHDDVRTYDGSWEEWGNDPDLPVVLGRS
ncbi:MAG: sulfurtransferase [Candidatus Limnocylindrales bacterium]